VYIGFVKAAAKQTESSVEYRHSSQSPLGRITETGHLQRSRGPAGWRVLDSFAVVLTLSGSARYRDALGADLTMTAGDLLIVFPGLSHTYGPKAGQSWSEFYAIFDGQVFDLWLQSGLLNPKRPVHRVAPLNRWLSQLESLSQTMGPTDAQSTLESVCRLQLLLAEAIGTQGSTIADSTEQRIAQACALLETDHKQQLSLESVAKQLGFGYESFRKQFAEHMGLPPAKYRAARLIDQACHLMKKGQQSDKQIAHALGFCDEFHFSRRFKQIVGATPSQFRSRASITDTRLGSQPKKPRK
jgi:AraC-like DNA-binding protein